MNPLVPIILSTFLISLTSFVGALVLTLKEKILNKTLLFLVAFSAGALMGGAFFHLIPEAIAKVGFTEQNILKIFFYLILGFLIVFILEHFIKWHHHHAREHPEIMPFSYLILLSDSLHNFIDGLIIAGSFIISFPLGVMTSLAVIFHEIPQEIGDFGILIYGGFKKREALFLNFISALSAILGGLIGFLLWEKIGNSIIFLLPLAAGSFLYIAASDLVPEIKNEKNLKNSLINFLVFSTGLIFMFLAKLALG